MSLLVKVADKMKAVLSDNDEVYFRDDGERCVVDGRVDMKMLARAAVEAMRDELAEFLTWDEEGTSDWLDKELGA